MRFKSFFTVFAVLVSVTNLLAQTCQTVVVPPVIVDGVEITHVLSGSYGIFENPYTSCGAYYTPVGAPWLGWNNSFTYTVNFNQPVNNVMFVLSGTGQLSDEVFTFNTNAGIPTMIDVSSCYSSVNGNVVTSGFSADSSGGGGIFSVSAPSDYNSLSIEGPGGSMGSLIALCIGIIPPPIPEPEPVSLCGVYNNLQQLEIPNVITPDGDGINDELLIDEVYTSCYSHEITIFNRWGNLIFQGTDATAPFSGVDLNGEKLSQGVYFYSFKSNNQEKTGYFSIF
ncbi:MAG TPA: gliding motility-associated C-terminal domain-containing protein [Fluviicola sp.]|nr:gliding motility-associated C-terminal domain-containing protein [Fluviicola sp.]